MLPCAPEPRPREGGGGPGGVRRAAGAAGVAIARRQRARVERALWRLPRLSQLRRFLPRARPHTHDSAASTHAWSCISLMAPVPKAHEYPSILPHGVYISAVGMPPRAPAWPPMTPGPPASCAPASHMHSVGVRVSRCLPVLSSSSCNTRTAQGCGPGQVCASCHPCLADPGGVDKKVKDRERNMCLYATSVHALPLDGITQVLTGCRGALHCCGILCPDST